MQHTIPLEQTKTWVEANIPHKVYKGMDRKLKALYRAILGKSGEKIFQGGGKVNCDLPKSHIWENGGGLKDDTS
jgi:hypothetical protein